MAVVEVTAGVGVEARDSGGERRWLHGLGNEEFVVWLVSFSSHGEALASARLPAQRVVWREAMSWQS